MQKAIRILRDEHRSISAVLQGLQLGCDGYVTKPYDVAVLMSTMKTVLGLK